MGAWSEGTRGHGGAGGTLRMRTGIILQLATGMGVRSWTCTGVGVGEGRVQDQNLRR